MATLTPGMWKSCDPRQHPDDFKRERSGFWTHEYRVENGEHVWRCDIHKMNTVVKEALMDHRQFDHFSKDPHQYLDLVFGEGTARAYFTKHPVNDRYMNYRMSQEMMHDRYMGIDPARGRDMALTSYASLYGGTTATGTTTNASTVDGWMREQTRKHMKKVMLPSAKELTQNRMYWAPTGRALVRAMPFRNHKKTLIESLQFEFDHWASKQLELVRADG